MKEIHKLLLCVVFMLLGELYAQQPPPELSIKKEAKASLFSTLPDQFEINSNELQKIFAGKLNEQITSQLSSQFFIEGNIVDKNQHTPGTFSVNIRLKNYKNALFNISLRLLADNTTQIQGRILHPGYNDVLILYKDKDKYFIKKQSQRLLMPD